MRTKSKILVASFITAILILVVIITSNLERVIIDGKNFVYNDPTAVGLLKLFDTPYTKLVKPQNTRSEYVIALYQIMKDFHDVANLTSLEYWVDYGTLLGTIRHHGIIPWDDDLNVTINSDQKDKFIRCVIPTLKKIGYNIENNEGAFQITSSANSIKLSQDERYPTCDVSIATEKDGKLIIEGWEQGIQIDYWKPLKQYKFGSFFVWGNADPIQYLNDLYGQNWWLLGNRGKDHKNIDGHESSKMPFIVSAGDYNPAEPTEPLIDNSKKIGAIVKSLDAYCSGLK